MGLRWIEGRYDIHTAWDGDVHVSTVSRRAEGSEWVGWTASYWGHDDRLRDAVGAGPSPIRVGGVWSTLEEAMAAVEEAHEGHASCE